MKSILSAILLMIFSVIIAQPVLENPEQQQQQGGQADEALLAHYAKVYQLALGLGDAQQQATALLNMYAAKQDDKFLYALSESYLNQKDYRKAFVSINSVKDSTTTEVYATKAWILKLAGDVATSSKYFQKIIEKDKTKSDIGFQIAVNQLELGKIDEAKKAIAAYKSLAKADDKVNTTDRTNFYLVNLNAAWENLEGLIMFLENANDAAKLTKNKEAILAHFDKALALEKDFVLAKQNKEAVLKKLGAK